MDSTASAGTGLASTRCSQSRRSMRLLRTWMKPLSRSRTATRSAEVAPPGPDGAARSLAVVLSVIGAKCRGRERSIGGSPKRVTGCSQEVCAICARRSPCWPGREALPGPGIRRQPGGLGGVGELAKESRDDERHLLADVHRVVADPLQRAGDEDHVHRPLTRVVVLADLDRHAEDLAVEAVDVAILAHQVLREPHIATGEGG